MRDASTSSPSEGDCTVCIHSLVCLAGRLKNNQRWLCKKCNRVWARGPHKSYVCPEGTILVIDLEDPPLLVEYTCVDCTLGLHQ